ncbi:CoA ester lyase [Comamonas sp. C11]|uniref:HpcH/HpaI aldolase/citrate lyase family protein n=1 Tax=Comamonas sp. C11 TaxID=2966554 RepID=UPI0021115342|nr:CoA ester lyase [Comamonas sp. C11]UUC95427.1 CoA ester lyase [Comamonas sp. C11]
MQRYPAPLIRSLFFAPANRADLVAKLPRTAADCYVLDLEDGTPEADKASARQQLTAHVAALRAAAMSSLVAVRVNEPSSPHHAADLQAAWASGADGLVVPKPGSEVDLQPAIEAARRGGRLENDQPTGFLLAGIETMKGVANAHEVCSAHPMVAAVYFGAEDFISDIGGRRTPGGAEVLYARSQVVLAARCAGITPIDQAVIEIRDDTRFQEDAERGRDLGYEGKICLLPRQATLAHATFSPNADEIAFCEHLISTYEEAMARGLGTIDFEGRMIDGPLLKRAKQVVATAARSQVT